MEDGFFRALFQPTFFVSFRIFLCIFHLRTTIYKQFLLFFLVLPCFRPPFFLALIYNYPTYGTKTLILMNFRAEFLPSQEYLTIFNYTVDRAVSLLIFWFILSSYSIIACWFFCFCLSFCILCFSYFAFRFLIFVRYSRSTRGFMKKVLNLNVRTI